jgi:hypothetical protein
MSILNAFSNIPENPPIAPYKPSSFGDVVQSSLLAGANRIEFGIIPMEENRQRYKDRDNQFKDRFTQDELKTINGSDDEIFNNLQAQNPNQEYYASDLEKAKEQRINNAILEGRKTDPTRWNDIKTSDEIQTQKEDRARLTIDTASEIASKASGFSAFAGSLVGGLGSAFLDPINLATLPFGASSGMGILKAMKFEALLNAGVELAEAPLVSSWQKQLGYKYGIGDTLLDVATAGVAGAGFTGLVRGARPAAEALTKSIKKGKEYAKEKSLPILQKISDSDALPSQVKDAAKYMSRVAHIDEEMPSRQALNGDIKTNVKNADIVAHRQTLQETQDSFNNYREPNIDNTPLLTQTELALAYKASANPSAYSNAELFQQYNSISKELNQLPKPKGLLQFIRESGGIKDEGGDLASYGITNKSIPGLIRKDGQWNSLDYTRERVVEAGYLPEEATLDDLLEAMREDFVNKNVFDEAGVGLYATRSDLEEAQSQLDEYFGKTGVNLNDEATLKRLKLESRLEVQQAGLRQDKIELQKAETLSPKINDQTNPIDQDLLFRPSDALASMEKDVADLDSLGDDVYNADFARLLKEKPDLEVDTPDGKMTIREIAEQLKDDEDILSAIKTCAIG